MTIMMRIFGKKKPNTKGIVEDRIAGEETPAGDANGMLSAPATFSNPFGLGQSESLVPPADGDNLGGLQQAIARAGKNGAPEVQAEVANAVPRTSGNGDKAGYEARDEPRQSVAEPGDALGQVQQAEAFTEMKDNSTDRPFNPFASIWTEVSGKASSNERDQVAERPLGPERLGGNGEPVSPLRPSEPQSGSSAPFERASGRDAAAPLISPADNSAPDLAGSELAQSRPARPGRDTKPSKAGRGDQEPRLNLRATESELQPVAQQPAPATGLVNRPRVIAPDSEMPRFSPVSSEPVARDPLAANVGSPAAQTKLWEAFTPSRPKYSSRFFAGRRWALQRIITAVEQDQAHIIIYGPRGIGKTSLANVLAESASEVEYQVLRFPCGSNATYEEIFRGLMCSLPADHLDRATQARFAGVENLEQLLPKGQFGPTDVTAVLSQIKLDHAILIIDEFDRVESKQLKNQLAETIKNLSDASARVTFIVIGIAHSLDELIGMHPSIQRHLVGIHLPLMTNSELDHVILAGEDASGIRFEDATRDMVVAFSKGLPYFAQLLSLHAGRTALRRGSMLVQMADLRDALELVLIESDPLARASYDTATREETDQLLIDVLFAAATARFDEYGTFTTESAAEMFVDSEGKTRSDKEIRQCLEDLAQQEDARVIEAWPTPTDEVRYAFVLQTMRQYILLRQAVRRGLM